MYVVWMHMCLLCLHITFGTLSIYVCIFCVCSVEGVRGKASEMTERSLFSRSIPLGLDLTAKEEKLPPFLAHRVNDKSLPALSLPKKALYTNNVSPSCAIPQPPLIQPSHVPGSMPTQQPKIFCHNSCSFTWYWRCLCVINSHLFCNSTCWYVFHSFTLWCVLECHFVWSFCKEHFLDSAFSCRERDNVWSL